MKLHTPNFYKTRIAKAKDRLVQIGFSKPNDAFVVLALCETNRIGCQPEAGTNIWRDIPVSEEQAVEMMVNGTAIRLSVTNSARQCNIFIDA